MSHTTVYFVRHAESDFHVRDEQTRPLTPKGMRDRLLVTAFLQDKKIDSVLSSPYQRAVDTISDLSGKINLQVHTVYDFRERKVGDGWIEDFKPFLQQQWQDFSYKLPGGECLAEVQTRNIAALKEALRDYAGKNITIGTHGTALSTIINYFDDTYGFADFMNIVGIMPWIVKMTFNGETCESIEKIDLFEIYPKAIRDSICG